MISILVLTLNEEMNLPECLKTVGWSDDIHVLDSNSSDRTVAVAEQFGAKVWLRGFDNWAQHQNWALKNIPFKYPWVFYLDADERVTPELKESMWAAVQSPGSNVAFRIRRRDFFLGTWLRHVQTSPFYLRLFQPDKMRYERLVNPVSIVDGPRSDLGGYIDHYPFSKGMSQWIDRHNDYSTLEARQIFENRASGRPFSVTAAFTARDFNERRFHQKELFYRLPGRPLIKFAMLYFVKLGLLDGKAGLTYALLQSWYEYMIVLKSRELTAAGDHRPLRK